MSTVFDPVPGKLFDFILAIGYCDEIEENIEAFRLKNASYIGDIEQAYRYIWNGLDTNTPGLKALTTMDEDKGRFIFQYFKPHIWKWRTADVFIEHFIRFIQSEERCEILSFYDEDEHPPEYYKVIAKNPARLHEFVCALNVTDRIRLDLIGIASGYAMIGSALQNLLYEVAERFDFVYLKNTDNIALCVNRIQRQINMGDELFLLREPLYREDFLKNNYKSIRITASFLHPTVCLLKKVDRNADIYIGIDNEYQFTYQSGYISKYGLFFKSLSDSSRIKIIELLRDREMYIGEISKVLGIPLTTLSYHIKMLIDAGIVRMRIEGKKTYCVFDSAQFGHASQALCSLGGVLRS